MGGCQISRKMRYVTFEWPLSRNHMTYDIHPRHGGSPPGPGREAGVTLVRILEEVFVSGIKVI